MSDANDWAAKIEAGLAAGVVSRWQVEQLERIGGELAEPVTADWLREIGGRDIGSRGGGWRSLVIDAGGVDVFLDEGVDGWACHLRSELWRWPVTRRELLGLLAGLRGDR